jgi:hypothetical protein
MNMKKLKLCRRRFLKSTVALAVAAPAFLGANESKNDRIAIG